MEMCNSLLDRLQKKKDKFVAKLDFLKTLSKLDLYSFAEIYKPKPRPGPHK